MEVKIEIKAELDRTLAIVREIRGNLERVKVLMGELGMKPLTLEPLTPGKYAEIRYSSVAPF